MSESAKTRQASRRARELEYGRRGRLFYLTDQEFVKFKEILSFLRETPETQSVTLEMTRTGDER